MKFKKLISSVAVAFLSGTTFIMTSTSTANAYTYGHAWIAISTETIGNWNITDSAGYIDITGNGSYSISFDVPEDCEAEQIYYLAVCTDIFSYTSNYKFVIDSIVVDGITISYNGPSDNASGYMADGITYCLSIYDVWSSKNVHDIDNIVTLNNNITINFTAVNFGIDKEICGENAIYSLDENTSTLTISGTGDMYDYSTSSKVPWLYYDSDRKSIKNVIIEDGITSISRYAFYGCTSLESITIPNSVTKIDSSAFNGCSSLTDVYFNGTEEEWNEIEIGENNTNLTDATIHFAEEKNIGIGENIVTCIQGDINLDDVVNGIDLVYLKKYILGLI